MTFKNLTQAPCGREIRARSGGLGLNVKVVIQRLNRLWPCVNLTPTGRLNLA